MTADQWSWHQNFTLKAEKIRSLASEALSNASFLADLRYHQPSFGYRNITASARELRSAADRLDEVAARMAPELVPVREAAE